MLLGLVHRRLTREHDDLVEVRVNNLAVELLQSAKKQVEHLASQLVDESMQKRVMELRWCTGRALQPLLERTTQHVSRVMVLTITMPMLQDLTENLESRGARNVLVKVSVECSQSLLLVALSRCVSLVLAVALVSAHDRPDSRLEFVQRFRLEHGVQCKLFDVDLD